MAKNKNGRKTAAKPKSKAGAVARQKFTHPAVRFVDFRAKSSERMTVVGAKLAEKLAHMRASMSLTTARFRHPISPVKRMAAKEAAKETKQAATERRKAKVANARTVAANKSAMVREKRAETMNRVL
ncbi:hypothetical protein O6H91_19G027400 [Diphasiastrum complanatum]|uniref:Uncharacterized protein n=2 Tax=Diphasiastrum complanatum TaxID=34168 RepID=A0ACC2ATL6_DIPCM|nr:hypothetical protein O6H91_19G026900 [Diphasiastrum complanatum]KAJ7520882.1 hypothetical protein O6H91_19G027400 [Diphasiastrum complanatum]